MQLEHPCKRKRRVSTAAAALNRQQQQPTSWPSCGCDSSGDASSCATRFWPVVTACMACAAQPAQGQLLRSSSGSIWGGPSAVERSNRVIDAYGPWASASPATTISASPACLQRPAPNHVQCGPCMPCMHSCVCRTAHGVSSIKPQPPMPPMPHLALRSAASAQPQKMAACSSGNTQARCEAVAPASMNPAGTDPGRSSSS